MRRPCVVAPRPPRICTCRVCALLRCTVAAIGMAFRSARLEDKDNRTIAQELHISLKTVDTHRSHLREKIGLKNGTELIHYAVRWVGEQV